MNRRKFLELTSTFSLILPLSPTSVFRAEGREGLFKKIIESARKNNFKSLPINILLCNVARFFIGMPYIPHTLEVGEVEQCIVRFDGFDCVTFFELSLAIARIIKQGRSSEQDLLKELTFIRYRNGEIIDYASRLHYSSDWIYDNIRKKVVFDKTKQLGGYEICFNLNFMTKNSQLYKRLKGRNDLISKIEKIEEEISSRAYFYLPKAEINRYKEKLETGDIVFFVTNQEGLDYSHVGICCKEKGVPRLLHASSRKGKVVYESSIVEYLERSGKVVGVTIVAPNELK
ncbi:MAG: DUF1460 domain-containing protein [Ignavibacteria bacterium]|nr:DUF1460 domain-containing protein [Ignavibacteria bacterium]